MTFPAWRNGSFVPLIELLQALSDVVVGVRWSLADAEFAPGWSGSEQLDVLVREGDLIPTQRLVDLVSDGVQLVDGRVDGLREGAMDVFVSLRSIRGDAWDVYAEPHVLDLVRITFEMVEDIPS